jgi:hypothetical protein
MARRARHILERAVRTVAEQAKNASADEAHDAGLDGSHTVTLQAKMLRLELLNVKADLERELGRLVLRCTACGQQVHRVSGVDIVPGHWAHREPAPHGEPEVSSAVEDGVEFPDPGGRDARVHRGAEESILVS